MSARASRVVRVPRAPLARLTPLSPTRRRAAAPGPNPPAPDPAEPSGESSLLGIVDSPLDWATEAGRALRLIGNFFVQLFTPSFWLRNFIAIGGIVAIVGGFIAFMRG